MTMTEEDKVRCTLDDMLTALYVSEDTKDYIFDILMDACINDASSDVIQELIEHYDEVMEL